MADRIWRDGQDWREEWRPRDAGGLMEGLGSHVNRSGGGPTPRRNLHTGMQRRPSWLDSFPHSFEGWGPRAPDHPHDLRADDRLYRAWREQLIRELDADYEAWRAAHHSRFEQDFVRWREQRTRALRRGRR